MTGVERRRGSRRVPAPGESLSTVRLRTGRECLVVNISCYGALVEGPRLLPGARIDMHVTTRGGRTLVRSHVLRCEVSRMTSDTIWYRSGIAFDQAVDAQPDGYQLPAGGSGTDEQKGSQYPTA